MSAVLEPKTATLAQLRAPAADNLPAVRMGFDTSQGFDLMQRGAKLLAASTLVPKEYQGNLPNCVIALNMASRIGADPLLVMQNLYVVHGRPGWSSKFLIASFNQCGRFSAIRFEWASTRDKDDWGCRAWATEKATGDKITGPLITIALAKKEGWYEKTGSKWKSIPELMLMYRSAGWLVNTHAPEISMGLNTVEELGDVFDAQPGSDGRYAVTTDDLRRVDTQTGEIERDETLDIPGAGEAPTVNYDALRKQLQEATDMDVLGAAATLIGQVPEIDRQNELAEVYKARAAELNAPKRK